MKKPIIGLTGNFLKDDKFFSDQGVGARGQAWTAVANDFAQVIIRAGGLPLIIPINADKGYDDHSLNSNYSWAYSHEVSLREDSIFYKILGKKRIFVNSFHHQAAADVPASFKLSGQADDGIIEAMEYEDLNDRFIMATQWHPEMMGIKDEDQEKLFAYFISQCK